MILPGAAMGPIGAFRDQTFQPELARLAEQALISPRSNGRSQAPEQDVSPDRPDLLTLCSFRKGRADYFARIPGTELCSRRALGSNRTDDD
jgi:hypothetical protein